MKQNFFAEYYLVENSWKKNYDYFVELFVQVKDLYENMTLVDILTLSDIPYPIFNDVILKQIQENKKQSQKIKELEQRNANAARR